MRSGHFDVGLAVRQVRHPPAFDQTLARFPWPLIRRPMSPARSPSTLIHIETNRERERGGGEFLTLDTFRPTLARARTRVS